MEKIFKERIKQTLRPHIIACEGKDWSDEVYEEYFLREYAYPKMIVEGNSFFSYKETEDYIWIQDFCSENKREAYKMLEKLIELGKPLKCQVQITNIKILNIILRKGFRIFELKGYNYYLGRN